MPKKSECTVVELRSEIADVLARAKIAGERIVVTKNGKPQAAIVSLADLALIEAAKKPKS
jgi:prevent-host-death family protein